MAGLSAGDGEPEPSPGREKTEEGSQVKEKMGLCSGLGMAEAGLASGSRAEPDAGTVVAGERAGGVGVANRVTVAGVGVATEPVDMARAGVATGMASDRVVVMARAAAGDARIPGLDGRKLAERGEFGRALDWTVGAQPGLCGLFPGERLGG